MSKGIFITGTGTDIGKTYVSGLILKKLKQAGRKAAYYKAAVSGNTRDENGCLIPGDAAWVAKVSEISQPVESMCPYVYERAYSPHLAARIEGMPVSMETVLRGFAQLSHTYEYITMEGSGGILCPIRMDTQEIWLEDIIKACDLSCLVVADAGLGTINAVTLTIEYLRAKHIPVKGIILNHFHPGNEMEEDNRIMCEKRNEVPVIATVQHGDTELQINTNTLMNLYDEIHSDLFTQRTEI